MKNIVNGVKVVSTFIDKPLRDDMDEEIEITGETESEYLRCALRNEGIRRKKMRVVDYLSRLNFFNPGK